MYQPNVKNEKTSNSHNPFSLVSGVFSIQRIGLCYMLDYERRTERP